MGQQNNFKVIAAVIAGALAGAALGLLIAPAKGIDTRKRMMKGVKDVTENLKSKISHEGVVENG